MSYPTLKGWLGGQSHLEARCRFVAGVVILALVVPSFLVVGQQTEQVCWDQITQTARRLVNPTVKERHFESNQSVPTDTARWLDQLGARFDAPVDLPAVAGRVLDPFAPQPATAPQDHFETAALDHFRRSAAVPYPTFRRPYTFGDGSAMEEGRTVPGKTQYQYAQAVLFRPGCLDCHGSHRERTGADGKPVALQVGDLAGVVVLKIPLEATHRAINQSRAVLIAAALTTAVLAQLAAFAAIRYLLVQAARAPQAPLG